MDGSRGLGEFFAAVAGRDLVAFDVRDDGEVSTLKEWTLDDLDLRRSADGEAEVALPWPSAPIQVTAQDQAGEELLGTLMRRRSHLALWLTVGAVALAVYVGGRYLYRATVIDGSSLGEEIPTAAVIAATGLLVGACTGALRLRRRNRFLR